MKAAAIKYTDSRSHPFLPYPNAATRQEILQKLVDILLMGAIGVGSAAAMMLLLVLV